MTEQSRVGQGDGVVHTGQHTCPVRMSNIAGTMGRFRGQTGVGASLECEYVRVQKHCSPTADGNEYST